MRESSTAVIERNVVWEGEFATEPWEAAWAREAIFFVRIIQGLTTDSSDTSGADGGSPASPLLLARVQISPDGMHWCDEGSRLNLAPSESQGWVRVSHFGGWLRLCGRIREGHRLTAITYLSLKA